MQGRGILATGVSTAAIIVGLAIGSVLQAAPAEAPKAAATATVTVTPTAPASAPKATPTVAATPTAPAATPTAAATHTAPAATSTAAGGEKMVPLELKLPQPVFMTTPKNIKGDEHMEPFSGDKPRPPFMVPEGLTNVALGKKVTSSDTMPIIGELTLITDGDKDGKEGCFVELAPGKQWIQIDLEKTFQLYAVVVWHYHGEGRVYHDVVVQTSDDADFIQNVQTVYNNDYDNSAGLGVGKDLEYIEDFRGRIIDAKGVKTRYLRMYCNGNTSNDQGHYIEVEVYGKPVK
jgi:hypothetical protein